VAVKRFDHSSDITVLEYLKSALPCSAYDSVHHGPGQVIGTNDLIGEQQSKRGVDRAQGPLTN
jgi:hypothetical protein